MRKLINICVLLSFQIGYLEWGKGQHNFIFETQYLIFSKAGSSPETFFHPLILVPLCAELLLLVTLFQKTPGRLLSLAGLAGLSLPILLLLFIGLITPNFKILGSTIPFIIAGVFFLSYNNKRKNANVGITSAGHIDKDKIHSL